MRVLDGLIRALTALLLLAVCAALCAVWFFGWNLPAQMTAFREHSEELGWVMLAGVGAVIAGLIALGSLLMPRLLRKRDKGYLVQRMGDDKVSVSKDVVEELAMAVIREHRELERAKVWVSSERDGVCVRIRCRLRAGTDLTSSVDYIQRQIRRHITDTTGLKVKEVSLRVESLSGAPLPIPDVPAHEEPEILPAGEKPERREKQAKKKRGEDRKPKALTDGSDAEGETAAVTVIEQTREESGDGKRE